MQQPILYNSEKKPTFGACKIGDMRSRLCFLYPGILGCLWKYRWISSNRPFARFGHRVQNHSCWWASCTGDFQNNTPAFVLEVPLRMCDVVPFELHCGTRVREKGIYISIVLKACCPSIKETKVYCIMSTKLEKRGKECPSFYNVYYNSCSNTRCLSKTVTEMIYFLRSKSAERKEIYMFFVLQAWTEKFKSPSFN